MLRPFINGNSERQFNITVVSNTAPLNEKSNNLANAVS